MRQAALVLGILVATAGSARADDATPPWARGVTDAQKATAKELLDEGNSRFVEHDYVAALAKYNLAIAAWDHPAIRFNIVRCLVQLDRVLEADDQLALALAYGATPLEDSVYSEALAYQKLLANQIGHVAIHCAQPGVEVSLDGHPVATCPAATDTRVAPGPHQVVGTRDGFVAKAASIVVVGGTHETVELSLVPIALAGVSVRRWAIWKPWTVLGAGLGATALGALVDFQASRDMKRYDTELIGACADTGCGPSHPVPPAIAADKRSAQHESELAVGVICAGLGAAAAGGVLLYLDRERTLFPAEHLDITPRPGGATIGVSGRF